MKKNNRNLFIGAFAVIGIGAYFVYKFVTKAKPMGINTPDSTKEEEKEETKSNTTKPKTTASVLPVASYPLKNGSKGSNVLTLQKWLNDNGYASPKLVTDGIFGAKTENAVKLMQETPFERAIADYNSKAIWTTDYKSGQITKDFYDKFIK